MSAFTFTAPIVTPEDEVIERAALSDEERKRVRDDVYGGEEIIEETDAMLEEGLEAIRRELQEIPAAEKPAYLEALERVPELVERESDPRAFLRCEKYDAEPAARRLVKYWETRRKIFGPDRAYLPMTQNGAMAQDMEYVRKALIIILPDDEHGRSVVYWDRIRSIGVVAPREVVAKIFFYQMQALCERQSSQKKGWVLIVNYRGYDLYKHFDRILSKKTFTIASVMPSKIRANHVCTGSGKSVMEVVLPVLKQMAGRDRRLRTNHHAGSDSEILARLSDYGLGEEHAHGFCGGALRNTGGHQTWLRERLLLEQERTNAEQENAA